MPKPKRRLDKTMDKLARAYADMIFSVTVSEEDKPKIEPSTAPINILLSSPMKTHKNINKDMLFSRKELYRDIQIVKSFEELRGFKDQTHNFSEKASNKMSDPEIKGKAKLVEGYHALTAEEAELDSFFSLIATLALRVDQKNRQKRDLNE
jgi:hypothetical protein